MRTASHAATLAFTCVLATFAATADEGQPPKSEHPADVALSNEDGVWIYRQFPTNLRLYVYDKDKETPGKSACNIGCMGSWPPVKAAEDAKPLGDWTIIEREDGRRQWAYKGRPVYIRFHDTPDRMTGDGHDGVWHVMKP